jgi:hypothetical protein
MCSINHDLKAIYFHIPKVGGLYIEKVLQKFYDFQTFYFTADNHKDYFEELNNNDEILKKVNEFKGFLNIRNKGIYRYFINSKNFNYISNMDEEKWKSYKKFTFVRNPYERCISAYKYLELYKKNISLEESLLNNTIINNYEYVHLLISQYDHIINNNDIIEFDYIGKFENLNEELILILIKLGIKEMKHLYYIQNNITINSSDLIQNKVLINNTIINLINNLFENDFKYFNYNKYYSYDDYIKNKKKINIIEQNINIINKYNFIKPIQVLLLEKIENNYLLNNIHNKTDIHNDVKKNILNRIK